MKIERSIAEQIYKTLLTKLQPSNLVVCTAHPWCLSWKNSFRMVRIQPPSWSIFWAINGDLWLLFSRRLCCYRRQPRKMWFRQHPCTPGSTTRYRGWRCDIFEHEERCSSLGGALFQLHRWSGCLRFRNSFGLFSKMSDIVPERDCWWRSGASAGWLFRLHLFIFNLCVGLYSNPSTRSKQAHNTFFTDWFDLWLSIVRSTHHKPFRFNSEILSS